MAQSEGGALTIAGFYTQGVARWVFIGAGLLIILPTVGLAIIRAIPPRLVSPAQVEGIELFIDDLNSIDPPVATVGIIGPEKSGKTTLRNLLLQTPTAQDITQRVTAHVSSIIKNPTTFLAILDGRGEAYAHQFEIAENASILCVLMDHHLVDGQTTLSPERLEGHRQFGKQVREHLSGRWTKRMPTNSLRVHVLLNKKDEWAKAGPADTQTLMDLLNNEQAQWRALRWVDTVTGSPHSNLESGDISQVANAIRSHWAAAQTEQASQL